MLATIHPFAESVSVIVCHLDSSWPETATSVAMFVVLCALEDALQRVILAHLFIMKQKLRERKEYLEISYLSGYIF